MGAKLFEQVQQQLLAQGYLARCGQIVDASLVQAPVQRNKREEADTVKESTMPITRKAQPRLRRRYCVPLLAGVRVLADLDEVRRPIPDAV